MSSRFPPPSGDARYPQRERSPQRFPDRRPTAAYAGSLASRTADTSYRPSEAHAFAAAGRDLPREPPRGPKASIDGSRGGGFSGRGRGFARGEPREKEIPSQRRDTDRDWPRRESFESRDRDRRTSPASRARSRSPVRDFRESRDLPPRDLDLGRVRRGSRDGSLSATSTAPDGPASAAFYGRGGFRGRGRGDWESRGRGRDFETRDAFHPRSRSRDRGWEREERGQPRDRDGGRREDERRPDWDRDADRYRRDAPPVRPASRNSSETHTRPSTPHSVPVSTSSLAADQAGAKGNAPTADVGRRASSIQPAPNAEARARDEKPYPQARQDVQRSAMALQTPSSPPQAPQVPAYGSVPRGGPASQSSHGDCRRIKEEPPARAAIPDPTKLAPKAPKAELVQAQAQSQLLAASIPLSAGPPTGPKAGTGVPFSRRATIAASPSRGYESIHEVRSPSQPTIIHAQSPSVVRHGPPHRPAASHNPAQPPSAPAMPARNFGASRPMAPLAARSAHSDMSAAAGGTAPDQPGRLAQGDVNARAASGAPFPSPVRIPRGPKAAISASIRTQPSIRAPMNSRGGAPFHPTMTWVNPKLRPPSIMNTVPPTAHSSVPTKRDHAGEERPGHYSDRSPDQPSSAAFKPEQRRLSLIDKRSKLTDESAEVAGSVGLGAMEPHGLAGGKIGPAGDSGDDVSGQAQSVSDDEDDEDEEEEEGMDLDEADYEDAEKRFERDLHTLNARRPPTPRHHPELLSLLEEIDALSSAAEDLASGKLPKTIESGEKLPSALPLGLPSPASDEVMGDGEEEEEEAKGHFRAGSDSDDVDLPLDNLPYLVSAPPTPFSQLSARQEKWIVPTQQNDQKLHVMKVYTTMKEQEGISHDLLKEEYKLLYRPWRLKTQALDEEKRVSEIKEAVTPVPVPSDVSASPATPVIVETGRRTGRTFNTQFEIDRVIELSKISREEEEARDREMQERGAALPDANKEAIIPDMLSTYDAKARIYEDTNHLIDTRMCLEAFAFVPPEDNFTEEEQSLFKEGYAEHPKKWGFIALAIPSRDYQDCIMHYYLTKRETAYKLLPGGKKAKKGRKSGKGPGRPKLNSNALLSNMERTQYDGIIMEQVAVTDTGRPKRAAAPTNFDRKADVDPATPNPTPARRAGRGGGDAGGESTGERTRKTRTVQPKEKGAKRGRAPLLAPNPSPSKKEAEAGGRSKELKTEDAQKALDGGNLPAAFHTGQAAPRAIALPLSGHTENWRAEPRPSASVSTTDVRGTPLQPPQFTQPVPPAGHGTQFYPHAVRDHHPQSGSQPQPPQHVAQDTPAVQPKQVGSSRGSSQTSSYWSVPEQTDFQNLVAHYGTDWQQIATMLKTKTPIMVKNYFHRQVERGEADLERLADSVDERNKREGPPTVPPPQPTSQPRRRMDAIPPLVSQRPLAPSTEATESENEHHPSNSLQASPPQFNVHQPRLAPLMQAASPAATTPNAQPQQPRSTHQSHGPRVGFFTAERPAQPAAQPPPTPAKPAREQQPLQPEASSQHVPQAAPPQPKPNLDQPDFGERPSRQPRAAEAIHAPIQFPPAEYPPSVLTSSLQRSGSHQPNPLMQRSAPSMVPGDENRRPRGNSHKQHSPTNSSPPAIRRLDTFGQPPFARPSHMHSPVSARPAAASPIQDVPRPHSVPIGALATQPPPARVAPPPPPPPPAKRSNIMNILNDEPAEPQPRKSVVESRIAAPTPPPQSPAISLPMYPQRSQPLPRMQRHDSQMDERQVTSQPQQQHLQLQQHGRLPYGQHPPHMQTQQQQQPPPPPIPQQVSQPTPSQQGDAPINWPGPTLARQYLDQRASYQHHGSPQMQPAYIQTASRPPFSSQQPAHAPSPPLPQPHARTSSYTGMHTQPQATQLTSSRYASLTPQQLPSHPQAPPPPRPTSTFSHSGPPTASLQNEHLYRQQHEALRQDELRRQEDLRRQENQRRQDEFRRDERLRQEEDFARRQDDLRRQDDRRHQDALRHPDAQRTYAPYGQQPPPPLAPPPQQLQPAPQPPGVRGQAHGQGPTELGALGRRPYDDLR